MEKRESFKSGLGFILVSAGCAIGLGNVWKFPYMAGQMGGGFFVLFYLIFLVLLGVPVLSIELGIGRASKKNIIDAYKTLERPSHKWHYHGWICIAGCYLVMSYYTTVSGWMTNYFIKFLTGSFTDMSASDVSGVYDSMLASPLQVVGMMAIVVVLGFLVCSFSLQGGLERVSKYMMLGLLLLIGVLIVNSFTLEGAAEGLSFYLIPDINKVREVGLSSVIAAAMNQAFFTLSIGMASMEIFGTYMSHDNTLTSEAVKICILDTVVAISAGLIIFPACFSFDVSPDAGPSLIFITLPRVFVSMPGGIIFGTLFFLFMTFASFTTIIGVFQSIIAFGEEIFGLTKIKSCIINCVLMLLLSLPAALGFNIWREISILGMNILDFEDYIVSNIILPFGALIFTLFATNKFGWGFDSFLNECNIGRGIRLSPKLKPYYRFALPCLISIVIIFCFI